MIYSSKHSFGALLVSCLALHAHAHAAIAPALGVEGNPVRSDVQRPSTAEPCGSIPVSDINTSTAVPLAADGSADFTVTNFNAGTDGSREVTAQVDPTGTGKSFEAATVTTNGDGNPTNVGSQPLVVQLPAGIQCKGGDAGNLCLMSFKTTSGFGNCAVVSQGAAAASSGGATAAKGASSGGAGAASNGTKAATGAGAASSGAAAAKGAAASGGTTAAKGTTAAGADAGAHKACNDTAAASDTAGTASNNNAKDDAAKAEPTAAKTNDGQGAAKTGAAKAGDATKTGADGKAHHHHKGGKGKGEGKGDEKSEGQATATAAAATATAAAKTASTPAGARAVRSFISASGGETVAKRGLSWSWIWA